MAPILSRPPEAVARGAEGDIYEPRDSPHLPQMAQKAAALPGPGNCIKLKAPHICEILTRGTLPKRPD
ncbi:hypothetical protein PGT21_017406 [Puccinia graminis f. sp. tritici]|uniref:Uncharacterized protein n=1 Tax=Puccinia graminis f. sp. tritici TaxID=56615 RepID=A0A5B0P2G7_PUCGR|nr:hypothetical protein PGT21_017406 [Puccinia graminis f. sp. tritici]